MRRNCNLELRLLPASPAYLSSSGADSDHHERRERLISPHEISPKTPNNQPLTIFYNGKICVCDVSDFQARAILSLASRETEERVSTPTVVGTRSESGSGSRSGPGSGSCSPNLQSPVYSPIAAESMKRSLQSFLQKRKHRALTMSPYHR